MPCRERLPKSHRDETPLGAGEGPRLLVSPMFGVFSRPRAGFFWPHDRMDLPRDPSGGIGKRALLSVVSCRSKVGKGRLFFDARRRCPAGMHLQYPWPGLLGNRQPTTIDRLTATHNRQRATDNAGPRSTPPGPTGDTTYRSARTRNACRTCARGPLPAGTPCPRGA